MRSGSDRLAAIARLVAVVVGAALILSFPELAPNPYILSAGVVVASYAALATSWNFVGGFTGYMSLGHVACRVRQQAEAVLESTQDGRCRQCLGSGGRELKGQGKAVQAATDPRDVGQRPLVGVEIGRDGTRPLHEELD